MEYALARDVRVDLKADPRLISRYLREGQKKIPMPHGYSTWDVHTYLLETGSSGNFIDVDFSFDQHPNPAKRLKTKGVFSYDMQLPLPVRHIGSPSLASVSWGVVKEMMQANFRGSPVKFKHAWHTYDSKQPVLEVRYGPFKTNPEAVSKAMLLLKDTVELFYPTSGLEALLDEDNGIRRLELRSDEMSLVTLSDDPAFRND